MISAFFRLLNGLGFWPGVIVGGVLMAVCGVALSWIMNHLKKALLIGVIIIVVSMVKLAFL